MQVLTDVVTAGGLLLNELPVKRQLWFYNREGSILDRQTHQFSIEGHMFYQMCRRNNRKSPTKPSRDSTQTSVWDQDLIVKTDTAPITLGKFIKKIF